MSGVSDDESATEVHDVLSYRAKLRVGETLRGKYRLDVLLGVGGMAAVYAATHRNESRAAIKVLHPDLGSRPEIRARFLREGRVGNTIGHPGVVRVVDEDEDDDGTVFLVMELLDGETLDARATRHGGKLPVGEVLGIADQVLDVLVAAHAKGIVHRDLKPENVFLTREGQVKVLDFGIARLREAAGATNATRAGTSMGTPAFMSPEQARGLWDEVDARSDLWAVGATMFALLAGKAVHDGRTTNEVLLSAMTRPAPAMGSVAPDLPAQVASVVDRALAFERGERWPDAAAMQEGVRCAYHDMHAQPITTAPRLSVPQSVKDRTLPSTDAMSPSGPGGQGGDPGVATVQPVTRDRTGTSLLRTLAGTPRALVIGLAGASAALALVVTVAVVVAGGSPGPSSSAAVATPPNAALEGSAPAKAEPATTVEPVVSPVAPPFGGGAPPVSPDELPAAQATGSSATPPPAGKPAPPNKAGATKAGPWTSKQKPPAPPRGPAKSQPLDDWKW